MHKYSWSVLVTLGCAPALAMGPADAAEGSAAHGAMLFGQQCQLCHSVEAGGGGGQGPNLAGVVGRSAGSAQFGYSRGMRNAGITWDAGALDRYLAGPAKMVPGTTMPARVDDAGERRDLIAYLTTVAGGPARAAATDTPAAPAVPAGGGGGLLTGSAAFGDWHSDAPGVRRRITVADLPQPFATPSSGNSPSIVDRPEAAVPHAPPGFRVDLFAEGLDNPRLLRVAPNGDVFVAETAAGRIRLLRAGSDGATAAGNSVFADDLDRPFGIAFYPPGPDPQWIYVAENNRVVRFAYRAGDTKTQGRPEVIVPRLTASTGGHSTRDIVFSPDGSRMFVSVGSGSNVADGMGEKSAEAVQEWQKSHATGAAWAGEENRADVLSFSPDGKQAQLFATGLRNCVGLAVQPQTGTLWCSTNERDGLGDNLVPDYVTRVRQGGFYGWPWYYLGDHEEPRLKGQRPDLKGHVDVPDVLLQPHSASLQLTFMQNLAFPAQYQGGFAAEHGSWNRARRTGYKVVRIVLDAKGNPTGEYDDFLTGFVVSDRAVWGRPVGVAVAHDGSLLVSEDANGTIWRVAYVGR